MQGILPIQPLFANIRLEYICEFSVLQTNSLRAGAGNFFALAGNFFGAQGTRREFGAKSIRASRRIEMGQKAYL